MKLSDYIISVFEQQKIGVVFGYMGGMITHLVDSIYKNGNVKFVQTYHEQSAAIAAEGYAIGTNNIGVAIATSGPGATNMMTGIADAYFDSIPVLYITGQVNTYEYKNDKPIRQQGFQETDVVAIVKPITKYAVLITDAQNIKYELEKALYLAKSGRPGPVLLDIPMDIQRAEISPSELIGYTISDEENRNSYNIALVKEYIEKSQRPMVLVGGGALQVKVLVNEFIRRHNLPVVSSLKGLGIINEDTRNYMGMIGSYGNRCANMSIANVDLLIVLGSRLDTRQTGAMFTEFMKDGVVIHVDIDRNELEYNRLQNRIQIHTDVASFLSGIENVYFSNYLEEWNDYLCTLKSKYNQGKEIQRFVENKTPYKFIQTLSNYSNENDIYTVDIGQNQMWAAQTLQLKKGQKFVTSGGLAPMGFALPTAVGIAFSEPHKTIYCICGDGGFHIGLQSLMLVSQYNLNIKIIVLNNKALGMITQFQQLYFDGRTTGTTASGGYEVPDIKDISSAYNLPYYKINEADLVNDELMNEIFKSKNSIIECVIEGLTSVSPKLEYNKPIENPIPSLSKEELEDALKYK